MTDESTWTPYASPGGGSVVGDLRVLPDVWSEQLGRARELYAWLPPSYATGERAYPLLVLHDGRNLFDASVAHSGEWQVDETMTALADEGIEAVVIAVPNANEARGSEYTPWPHPEWGGGDADAYLDWLVDDVLPLARSSFRVVDGPEATGIGGSSLGGYVSLYAFLRRPDVFGRALVMSPAFWWNERIFDYAADHATGHGRIWLDTGDSESEEGRTDLAALYVDGLRRMETILRAAGYDDTTLRTEVDPGGVHREHAWARRLPAALRFLLG